MLNFKDQIKKFNRLMAAITFAEADEREIAMEVMIRDSKKRKHKRTGSKIIRQENTRPDMRI